MNTIDKIKDKLFTCFVAIPLAVFFLGLPLWFMIAMCWAANDVITDVETFVNGIQVCSK